MIADSPYPGLLSVAFLAHLMRHVPWVRVSWHPRRCQFNWHILTGPTHQLDVVIPCCKKAKGNCPPQRPEGLTHEREIDSYELKMTITSHHAVLHHFN
jgi:hypothetical protein